MIVKYSDMVEVKSEKTGEVKQIPATEVKKLQKPEGEKTGEVSEWKVINEESSSVRVDGSDRQE
jgi:hypothetical protein